VAETDRNSQSGPPPDAEWLVNQIAHTLRNPIFAAMVQAEALVMRAGEDEGIANAAKLVYKQLKRLEVDINEMLLYGRPPKINPRRVRLAQVVEQVAARFQRGEHGQAARVEANLPPGDLELTTDPDAVVIVLDRLLLNAVQHTPEPHQVRIGLEFDDQNTLRFTVSDGGEGIPDNVQEKMYLPFYPQHSGRPGLGLAVAAKFAHALGGSLSIRSAEGVGTTVTVVVPANHPDPVPGTDRTA
jgi:signal transduction histidine kinase